MTTAHTPPQALSMHLLVRMLALVAAFVMSVGIAHAQGFPSRPIRIVIGVPAGGGSDLVARILAPRLTESLGQPVIVDNRPGANGVIATEFVAKSAADGHTILFGTTGNLSVNTALIPSLPFNMERDFVPVTQVSSVPFLLYSYPGFPPRTLAELIEYARANPGRVNYYSSGSGGLPHLAGELLNATAKIATTHVPYKGSAPGLNDLIAGHVQFGFDSVAIGLPHVKAGKLRALAVTGRERLPFLPDVPTVGEILPGYEVVNAYGMVVPAGTPRDAIARLQSEVVKAMSDPEIKAKLLAQGTDPVGSTPGAFGAFLKGETVKWGRVVKEANVHVD